MTARTTIKLNPTAPSRDPRRPRVRGAAPLPTKVAPKDHAPARSIKPVESRPLPTPPGHLRELEAAKQQPVKPPDTKPAAPAGLVRLSKLLSDRGLASRRQADDWIAAGWVLVDGHPATLGQRVLPTQRIDIAPAAKAQHGRSGSRHRSN